MTILEGLGMQASYFNYLQDEGWADGGVQGTHAVDYCVSGLQLSQHAGIWCHNFLSLGSFQGAKVQHSPNGCWKWDAEAFLVYFRWP